MSLGGVIGRTVTEDCDLKFPVRNLVTLGGPHMGIDVEKNCKHKHNTNKEEDNENVNLRCDVTKIVTNIFGDSANILYNEMLQHITSTFELLRSKKHYNDYLRNNIFLPYLNNEKSHGKENQYKKRMEALNSFTMFKFSKDPIIYPHESAWFGEVSLDGKTVPMEETGIYKQNTLGLKTLDDEKRIERKQIDGFHL